MINLKHPLFVAIAGAFIGALAATLLPTLLSDTAVELEVAPFYNENFFDLPEVIDGKVNISVSGQKNESPIHISILDIYLFNRSSRPFNNIELTFEFFTEDGSIPPEPIGSALRGPTSLPQDKIRSVHQDGETPKRFEITSFTPSDKYNTDFKASFAFIGKSLPKVRVQSDYADGNAIKIYEFDKDLKQRKDLIVVSLVAIGFVIIFADSTHKCNGWVDT